MTITISIQDSTWKELNARKNAGETFDSVIKKALNEIPALPTISDENMIEEIKKEVNR
jgi:predicted CopG family antitoxin